MCPLVFIMVTPKVFLWDFCNLGELKKNQNPFGFASPIYRSKYCEFLLRKTQIQMKVDTITKKITLLLTRINM